MAKRKKKQLTGLAAALVNAGKLDDKKARKLAREQKREDKKLSPEELDDKPFGVIKLDKDGTILLYNARESELTGRKAADVVGKNFFREVAPCTDVQEFAGAFRAGVERESLHQTFPYVFDYKMQPRKVWVTLYWCGVTKSGWVLVLTR